MIIANPIYDVVFKYLLEDIEIARELLSTILAEEVISLDLKPQETASENQASSISILRFDFKAIIKLPNGEVKKLLIELQKAKQVFDVMRFRRYLGDNYRKEDDLLNENGLLEKRPLPIVTIYLLGFPLDTIQNPVVKINREYKDAITQQVIHVKDDFIELLTHDSYLIQLRRLTETAKTKLERVLQVFSPAFQTKDPHQLDFQGDVNEPLVKRMVDRLGRAIASEEIRDKMDVEDEIDRTFERGIQKITLEKDKIIAEKEQLLALAKQQTKKEKQKAEKEKEKAQQEKQKTEKAQEIAEKAQEIAEQERKKNKALLEELEALKKQIQQKP